MHEGDIYTIAGTGSTGYSGNGAIGTAATLNSPLGVAVDSSGNVYIADTSNNVIREVTASTGDISLVAGGTPDGRHGSATNGYGGDGGSANVATLSGPNGVAVDGNDNVYIADTGNNVIREVAGVDGTQFTQSMTVGDIYTIAGTAGEASYYGDGGFATDAVLNNPTGVAADASGNVYVADYTNNIVREITTADGNINTVAGTPTVFNYTGDGELATNATMSWENGIALDSSGHLYIADTFNGVIREVS
jgi:streptogramin lyase